jgi:hypothetical protein
MIKIMHENDYSETDEFTLIKEMNHWIKDLKKFFVDDKKAQKAIADYFYYDDGAHQEDFKELQSSVKTLHKLWLKLDNIVEEAEEREYKKSKNESYRLKEEDTEIEVENPGLLEVPEGKNVDDLPLSHFVKLANKKGLGKIVKGLNNLQVWNKNKDPKLSKWAGDMIDKLNKKLKKDESYSIKELFTQDEVDRLISDMEAIGFEYDGTDNRGRLLFNSWDGNSTQAFPDWEEVEKYLENGSEPFEFESCDLTEDYKNDLKKFADANIDKFKSIANKCGYKFYNDSYYKETKTGNNSTDYNTVLCYDFYEIPRQDGDMNKFDKELNRYFKKFDFRYILDDLPNRKTLCIYY